MIKVRNLDKFYETGYGRTYVLCRVNIDVAQGEFVTIMGPSGAGQPNRPGKRAASPLPNTTGRLSWLAGQFPVVGRTSIRIAQDLVGAVQPLGHLLGVDAGVAVGVMEQHQPAVSRPDSSTVGGRFYLKQFVKVVFRHQVEVCLSFFVSASCWVAPADRQHRYKHTSRRRTDANQDHGHYRFMRSLTGVNSAVEIPWNGMKSSCSLA